jgi:hypothetical protein
MLSTAFQVALLLGVALQLWLDLTFREAASSGETSIPF